MVHRAAQAYAEQSGHAVWAYKNNTDFHGASYGTHENYLVPREVGFERLYRDLMPMLVARMVLVGAGKVGSEAGADCEFQLSQRADFYIEPVNTETLYRRPIFNTRDEPHADPAKHIRLHVICGDANMIPDATARKVGLVKLALALCEAQEAPRWRIVNPVRSAQSISKDKGYKFEVGLEGRSWTTADEILESYFAAGERVLDLDDDLRWVIESSRELLRKLRTDFAGFARRVDWAAKRRILQQFIEEEGTDWRDPALRAYDLEYHNVDPESSLHTALEQMGEVEQGPPPAELQRCLERCDEPSRARARGTAVRRFREHLVDACWRTLTFDLNGEKVEIELLPNAQYPVELEEIEDVGTFVRMVRGVTCPTVID